MPLSLGWRRTAYGASAPAPHAIGMILAWEVHKEIAMLTILLIASVLCFFLAAFGVPSAKVNLVGLGLALWALAVTIEKMVV